MSTVKPVPDGFHTVTPYLMVEDAAAALDFYERGLGATEVQCHKTGDRVIHVQFKIGDSIIMMGENRDLEPRSEKGYPRVSVYLYVDDADALTERAVAAGGKLIMPVRDEFYGDRIGGVQDPWGMAWWIATHKEDLSGEELARRAKEAYAKRGA